MGLGREPRTHEARERFKVIDLGLTGIGSGGSLSAASTTPQGQRYLGQGGTREARIRQAGLKIR